MNRKEIIATLKAIGKHAIESEILPPGDIVDATAMAVEALVPKPDEVTGLVPCGCGGRAFVYCPVDMTDVFVIRCEKCRVGITFAMDLPRAKKEWNTAMGWRVEG